MLTGAYPHSTGVYGNRDRHGGFHVFDDTITIATVLQDSGYRTGLFGKYLNGYGEDSPESATYVPPGWDEWAAIVHGGAAYYNYTLNEQGAVVSYDDEPEDYLTDVLFAKAQEFIAGALAEDQPFFAFVTPVAPHKDAVPEEEYATRYDALPPWRPPSYNEADVSDKPRWARGLPLLAAADRAILDELRKRQYETLVSTDDGVGAIIDQLDAAGQLENTLLIYTSDNGYFWGEHRLEGKNRPYEEATRVPMVVSLPGGVVGVANELATNIDFSPTFAELAGTTMPNAEGLSLLPFLTGEASRMRSQHLVESMGVPSVPAWCQLRTKRVVFTHYANGDEEYYNLDTDPLQLSNRPGAKAVRRLRNELRELATPLPPGMSSF
jgi:arylsulfatase A-like enzyme